MLFVLILWMIYVGKCVVLQIPKVDPRPGAMFQIEESTLNFVAQKLKPYVESQLKYIYIGTIISDQKVHIHTIGDFYITLDGAYIKDGVFDSVTLTSFDGGHLEIKITGVSCTGYVHWHYVGRGWPHITDSGHLDLTELNVNMDLKIGAVIDKSHSSHVKISASDIEVQWNAFEFVVHAGAGWLYQAILDNFKGDIEKMITSNIEDQVGPMLDVLQKTIDAVKYVIPIPGLNEMDVNYVPDFVSFDMDQRKLTAFCTNGYVSYKGEAPPGEAQYLPYYYGSRMVSIFITEWTLQSAIIAASKAGYLHTVLEDNPHSPIRLNTDTFKLIVPDMYNAYPDEKMDIDVHSIPGQDPQIIIADGGMNVKGLFDSMFRVKNGTHLINAFRIRTTAEFDIKVSVKTENPLAVAGSISMKTFKMNLTYNIFKPFPVSSIGQIFQTIMQDIVCPLINVYLEQGIPIPSIPGVTLSKPNLYLTSKGWMYVGTDFDFVPPHNQVSSG